MILSTGQIVLMSVGTVLLVAWACLLVVGRKHESMFATLEPKDFPLRAIYPVGYALLEQVRYSFQSRGDSRLREQLEVLYDRQYSEYYMRTVRAQQASAGLTLLVLSFGLYGLTGSSALMVLTWVLAGLTAYYFQNAVTVRIRQRNEQMIRDFCEVVSTLALLTNAGMILREAWRQTSLGADRVIYQEMRLSVEEIDNGMPEVEAIHRFGIRSMLPEVKKFASTLAQSVAKGGGDLPATLTAQSSESWHIKKQLVQRESNKAASKLLFPMLLMFAGILVMVIVPMFLGIGL